MSILMQANYVLAAVKKTNFLLLVNLQSINLQSSVASIIKLYLAQRVNEHVLKLRANCNIDYAHLTLQVAQIISIKL